MNKITINKKGAKMRKFILPILVAGAIAFTATQSFAALYNNGGTFVEATNGTPTTGPTNTLNHYKTSDSTEYGAGNWQIDSAYLKGLGNTFDGDASYGYSTGDNPFGPGYAGPGPGSLGETDLALPAPAYSMPCPTWVASPDGTIGGCPANTVGNDPQTDDPKAIWDGTVMDDLYNIVGVNDGDWTSGGVVSGVYQNEQGTRRILDQTLDALFYNGKRGNITYTSGATTWKTPGTSSSVAGVTDTPIGTTLLTAGGTPYLSYTGSTKSKDTRYFNVDQTLDQDLADYTVSGPATSDSTQKNFKGIFGKLNQNFQIAGQEFTKAEILEQLYAETGVAWTANLGLTGGEGEAGCASWGGSLNGEDYTANDVGKECTVWNAANESLGGTTFYDLQSTQPFSAVLIEQWLVAEMSDWVAASGDSKVQGLGTKQEYHQFFRDGSGKDFAYEQKLSNNKHGDAKVTPGAQANHGSMDP